MGVALPTYPRPILSSRDSAKDLGRAFRSPCRRSAAAEGPRRVSRTAWGWPCPHTRALSCHPETPRGIWGRAFRSPCRRSAAAEGSRRVSRTAWGMALSTHTLLNLSSRGSARDLRRGPTSPAITWMPPMAKMFRPLPSSHPPSQSKKLQVRIWRAPRRESIQPRPHPRRAGLVAANPPAPLACHPEAPRGI